MICNCKPHDCNCHLKEDQMSTIKKVEYQAWLAQANSLISQLEPVVGREVIDAILLNAAPALFTRILIENRDINETPVEIKITGATPEVNALLSYLLRCELMCNLLSHQIEEGSYEIKQ